MMLIFKEENTKFMQQIESSTDPQIEQFIAEPKNQSKHITVSSLVQTTGTYLHRIVNSFMEILPSLALDLLNFYQNPEKTNRMVSGFPYIMDNMQPFI